MTTTMNGYARDAAPTAPVMVPLALPVQRLGGEVSPWPPHRPGLETAAQPETTPRRDIDGDKLRRAAMWFLASGVAAIAAIVSYSHIYDLGRVHGGTGVPARLLPLSVDMLIVAGELMLLHEADAKGRRFVLGWVLVWSGILATLAANVAFGAQFGIVGALIWGWPAYSFILAAGGMVSIVKRAATREDDAIADCAPAIEPDIEADTAMGPAADKDTDSGRDVQPAVTMDKPLDKPQATRPRKPLTGLDKAADILRRNPGLSNAEVAKRAGVSEKTVSRARSTVTAPKDVA